MLIARKRYLPRQVTQKGQLEAMGVQRASAFRHDVQYREGRQFRKSHDRRAIERMSTYGKKLLQDRWTGTEHEVMSRLWHAGVSVPYPIAFADDVFDLEYVGSGRWRRRSCPPPPLSTELLADAFEQLLAGLRSITAAGIAHGDLSAYNLLWWEDRLWFIDFPQSIDIAANLQGLDFLHRDVLNMCGWFAATWTRRRRRGGVRRPAQLPLTPRTHPAMSEAPGYRLFAHRWGGAGVDERSARMATVRSSLGWCSGGGWVQPAMRRATVPPLETT